MWEYEFIAVYMYACAFELAGVCALSDSKFVKLPSFTLKSVSVSHLTSGLAYCWMEETCHTLNSATQLAWAAWGAKTHSKKTQDAGFWILEFERGEVASSHLLQINSYRVGWYGSHWPFSIIDSSFKSLVCTWDERDKVPNRLQLYKTSHTSTVLLALT